MKFALEAQAQNGSNSLLNGMPMWVKAIATVGAPIAFAAWLLVFLTQVQGARLDAIDKTLATHVVQGEEVRTDMRDFLRHHSDEIDVMKSILQQICANGASNAIERQACFPQSVPK
jgi:hypothetical protein